MISLPRPRIAALATRPIDEALSGACIRVVFFASQKFNNVHTYDFTLATAYSHRVDRIDDKTGLASGVVDVRVERDLDVRHICSTYLVS